MLEGSSAQSRGNKTARILSPGDCVKTPIPVRMLMVKAGDSQGAADVAPIALNPQSVSDMRCQVQYLHFQNNCCLK